MNRNATLAVLAFTVLAAACGQDSPTQPVEAVQLSPAFDGETPPPPPADTTRRGVIGSGT